MSVSLAMLILYAAYLVTSPLLIIFHELGHAFAYLVLTKPDNIDVFIGSYGNTEGKINFRIGRMHFYVKPTFYLLKSGGMCRSSKRESNYINEIIILLAGPVFTVIVAAVIAYVALNTNVHGSVKLLCFALIIFSVVSLIQNLIPRTLPGTNLKTDGKALLFTIRNRKIYAEYVRSLEAVAADGGEISSKELAALVAVHPHEEAFVRPLISYLLWEKNYADAEIQFNNLRKFAEFRPDDYINLGFIQTRDGRHNQAIENYRIALDDDPENVIALNNLGYELLLKGDYQESESLLQQAITLNPEHAFAYNNLGHVKILTNEPETGRVYVKKSMELDPGNAYVYRTMGIYYLKTGDKAMALENFNKALAMDATVDLNPYLQEAGLN